MELKDIKAKIADLRFSIEELSDECFNLWKESGDTHTESVAEYLQYELTAIACKLGDLEETEEETETDIDAESDMIADWWTDLELRDKCELANIPYPTNDSGRGEEYFDAQERADKWWNSRTYEQKKAIYEENLAWLDK